MNKKNKIVSVSSILSLFICLLAAIIVWLFAKYNSQPTEPQAMIESLLYLTV